MRAARCGDLAVTTRDDLVAMKHVPLIALAVALLAHPASPFALLAPRPLRAATTAARIFTPLRMEEDAAEEPAADATASKVSTSRIQEETHEVGLDEFH